MKRLYVLGLDAYIVRLVKRFVDEGALPNFRRMFEAGCVAEVLPSIPAYTPTNWTTLSTGAQTGTHGLPRWTARTPEGRVLSSFDARAVTAETIFQAAERQGHKSIAIRFPATMPSPLTKSFVVDGFGTPNANSPYQIAERWGYRSAPGGSKCDPVDVKPATGWTGTPASSLPPREFVFVIRPKFGGRNQQLHALVTATANSGYDRVLVCTDKNVQTLVADLRPGGTSGWVRLSFELDAGQEAGYTRFKLMDLDRQTGEVWLYRAQVNLAEHFTHPNRLAQELIGHFGPYLEHVGPQAALAQGFCDYETTLEEAEYQGMWIVQVAKHMFREHGCSLFACHWHWPDHQTHAHLAGVDPASPHYDPAAAAEHWERLAQGHAIADRMLGALLEEIDENTAVVVVSDHGNSPNVRAIDMGRFLEERGYLVRTDDGTIDWEKTQAWNDGRFDIFINAEGDVYRGIQDRLIRDLRTWIDPGTGLPALALALRKEQAQLVGYWGDQAPDVLAVWEGGYGGGVTGGGPIGLTMGGANHGCQFPTTSTPVSSLLGTWMAIGGRFKQGYRRPPDRLGYMRMIDIVPTLCRHLDIDPPAQSQGAVCFDFFADTPPPPGRALARTDPLDLHFERSVAGVTN